jgi:hypothetical protein
MAFTGVSALRCLRWDKVFRAQRSGFSDRRARVLRPLSPRLPGRYLASMLADVLLLIGVPYAEELLRCPRRRITTGAVPPTEGFTSRSRNVADRRPVARAVPPN